MKTLFDFQFPEEFLVWNSWLYLILALVVLAIGSVAYRSVRKVQLMDQLAKKDNPALAISYAGFMAALGVVISGVILSPSHFDMTWQEELLDSIWWTLGGTALLLVALLINDFIIFPKFKNRKEILEDRNTGLAVVEASSFISTALLIRASLSEQINPVDLGEPWLTLIYFVIGQALFLLYSRLYPKAAALDLHGSLEKDNTAVGVAFGGSMLAFAWLLGTAKSRYDGIPTIIVLALAYMAILCLMRFIVRYFFAQKMSLADEFQKDGNWGLAIVEATLTVIIAAVLIASL